VHVVGPDRAKTVVEEQPQHKPHSAKLRISPGLPNASAVDDRKLDVPEQPVQASFEATNYRDTKGVQDSRSDKRRMQSSNDGMIDELIDGLISAGTSSSESAKAVELQATDVAKLNEDIEEVMIQTIRNKYDDHWMAGTIVTYNSAPESLPKIPMDNIVPAPEPASTELMDESLKGLFEIKYE